MHEEHDNIRLKAWDKTAKHVKTKELHVHASLDTAGMWNEGKVSYRGRSHGRIEIEYEIRLKKIYHDKSAETMVPEVSGTTGK